MIPTSQSSGKSPEVSTNFALKQALDKLGVALGPVHAAVEEKIGRRDHPVEEETNYVPRVRKVLSLALDEAERQGMPLFAPSISC